MRRALFAAALIAAAIPAAQADESQDRSPEALAKEGITRLMEALELLIDEIPQYAAPEVRPNGDIIIRRLDKVEPEEREREDGDQPEAGETEET